MRKGLLIAITICTGIQAHAQRAMHGHNAIPLATLNTTTLTPAGTAAKTTAVQTLTNIAITDTTRIVYTDTGSASGYVTGTNSYGDMGFAERYDFNGADSSIRVLGVYAQFGGTVNPASTNNVNFRVWKPGAPVRIKDSLYYNNFPALAIDSVSVPFTQLGIGPVDTVKSHMFAASTANLSSSFFVGYTLSYNYNTLNGDTIGLASSLNGHRNTTDYTFRAVINADDDTTSVDTILNVQNATQWSDGLWYDNYTQSDSIANNLAIYPIVSVESPTGLSSISRNSLTFFGGYPNPAGNSVNIRYALATPATVTIDIMDLSGHLISTTKTNSQSAGEHISTINTAAMAIGEYIYIVRTSAGDGIASKLTIIK